ncbi:MAG: uroporphyrinogen-III synthase [Saprospiraceae bacterium]
MVSEKTAAKERFRPVQSILISQPDPQSNRSPFYELAKKWNIKLDWRPFIEVVPIPKQEFRKSKVNLEEYTAIVFTSKNAVDFYFNKCEELKINMPTSTKYFCSTVTIANYLQKYIVYRKRKIFFGEKQLDDILPLFEKFKENEKFLLPTSNLGSKNIVDFLNKNEIVFDELMMFMTVSSNITDLENIYYDMLVFFNPLGIASLYENFPNFKQNNTRIAVFGEATKKEAEAHDLVIDIMAPSPETPSIVTAIDNYMEITNKK